MSTTEEAVTTPTTAIYTPIPTTEQQGSSLLSEDQEVQFRRQHENYVSTPLRLRRENKTKLHFKDIEPFDGTSNINEWIYKWQHVSRLNSYSENEQLDMFPLILRGKALTVLRSLNRTQRESPDEILHALVKRFEPQSLKQAKKVALFCHKMAKEEELEDFIETLLAKARDIELPDSDILSIFISNVTTRLRSCLMMAQPTTLAEALNVARLKAATLENCEDTKDQTNIKLQQILAKLEQAEKSPKKNEVNQLSSIEQAVERMTALVAGTCKSTDEEPGRVSAISEGDRLTAIEDSIKKLTEMMSDGLNDRQTPARRGMQNRNTNASQKDNWPRDQERQTYKFNANRNNNQAERDMRTTDGRPICQHCRLVGHTKAACFRLNNSGRPMYATRTNRMQPNTTNQPFTNRNNTPHQDGTRWQRNQGTINIIKQLGCDKNMCLYMDITSPREHKEVKMLLDTGACVSLINTTLFPSLRNHILEEKPMLETIVSVTGSIEQVEGLVSLQIQPTNNPDINLTFKFHLAKLNSEQAIIGRDFLSKHKSTISLGENTVTIATPDGNKILALDKNAQKCSDDHQDEKAEVPDLTEYIKDERSLTERVKLTAEQKIGAGSTELIGITSPLMEAERSREHTQVLFEPSDLLAIKGLEVISFLSSQADRLLIPITNPTSREITIQPNILGRITLIPTQDIESNTNQVTKVEELRTEKAEVGEIPPLRIHKHPDMTEDQSKELQQLLRRYEILFRKNKVVPKATNTSHTIRIQPHSPIVCHPYRCNPSTAQILEDELKKMKDRGIIEESTSQWSFPLVLVRKKSGGIRVCLDLRRLNMITLKEVYPTPKLEGIIDTLSGARIFTTLDIREAFYHIELDPDSRNLTSFSTQNSSYRFRRMPMGAKNSSQAFQRLINTVLRGVRLQNTSSSVHSYLDDLIIASAEFKNHLTLLEDVLNRLLNANLSLNAAKCNFAQEECIYLGHKFDAEGVHPDPSKTSMIKVSAPPKNAQENKSLLGLYTYYKKFIKNFQEIALPMYELCRKDVKFKWTTRCQQALDTLKERLINSVTLAYPDFKQPFIVQTDASDEGIGFVLSQKNNGVERPVYFAGRVLSETQRNYTVFDKEALALVEGIKYYKSYLMDKKFSIITDHNALRWLMSAEPKGRVARYQIFLSQFDFEIIHRQGSRHGNADALSRKPLVVNTVSEPEIGNMQKEEEELCNMIHFLKHDQSLPWDKTPERTIIEAHNYFIDENDTLFHVYNGKAAPQHGQRIQLVVPKRLVGEILSWTHESPISGSHLGFDKTLSKVLSRYFWKGVYRDTKFYVQSCTSCGTRKINHQAKAPLQPYPALSPWRRCNIDICGPWPESRNGGNKYIVAITDSFTKYVIIKATREITAERISKIFFEEVILKFGAPKFIVSDQGKQFTSRLFQEISSLVNCTNIYTTAYHPMSNGGVERMNQTLANALAMYVSQRQTDWDIFIPGFCFAYNTSHHTAIDENPHFMNFGRDAVLPGDVALLAKETKNTPHAYKQEMLENLRIAHEHARYFIQKAAVRMKEIYDRKAEETKYKEGDKVYIYNPPTTKEEKRINRRLQHHFHGPFRLGPMTSPVNFELMTIENEPLHKEVHVNRLKKYIDMQDGPLHLQPPTPEADTTPEGKDEQSQPKDKNIQEGKAIENNTTTEKNPESPTTEAKEDEVEAMDGEEDNVYAADHIVKHRYRKGGTEYLIHWAKPFDDIKYRSWEPEANCGSALLNTYHGKDKKERTTKRHRGGEINSVLNHPKERKHNSPRCGTFTQGLLPFLSFATCLTLLGAAKTPEIGTIYNCETTRDLGIFALPEPATCQKSKWNQPETFKATVYEYKQDPLQFKVILCRAERQIYDCKTNFFGAKDKIKSKVYAVETSPEDCRKAYTTKMSPYGELTKLRNGKYGYQNEAKFVCAWMKDRKATYHEYTLDIKKALLYPLDPIVHQPITSSDCTYDKAFTKEYASCTPIENPKSKIIWKMPKQTELPEPYHSKGVHDIIKSNDWIFVPELALGGGINSIDKENTIFLDTGYIISSKGLKDIPKNIYKEAIEYVTKTKSASQRDVLAGHIGQNIFMTNSIMTILQKQLCHSQRDIKKQQSFLIAQLPDLASEHILRKYGYMLRPLGDGFTVHRCLRVKKYSINWKREIAGKCFNDLIIEYTGTTYSLRLPERKILPLPNPIPCQTKTSLVIKDKHRKHWLLSANGSTTMMTPQHRHGLRGIEAPRLKRFNSEMLHYTKIQLPRVTLLQTLADNRDVLEEFGNIRDKEESFLPGLVQFINDTVMTLTTGGSALITAVGNAIKTDLEGSAEVIHATGSASKDIISSTAKAVHTLLNITGPLALGVTLILAAYIFFKFIYPQTQCKPQTKHNPPSTNAEEQNDIEIICMEPQLNRHNDQAESPSTATLKRESVTTTGISKSLASMMVIIMILSAACAQPHNTSGACWGKHGEERKITSYILKRLSILSKTDEIEKGHHAKGVPPILAQHYFLQAKKRKNSTGQYLPADAGWRCDNTFLTQICQDRQHKINTCVKANNTLVTSDGKRADEETLWWKQNFKLRGRIRWENLPGEVFRLKNMKTGKYLCPGTNHQMTTQTSAQPKCTFYLERITKKRVAHMSRINIVSTQNPLSFNTKGQQRRVWNGNPNHKSIRFLIHYVRRSQLRKMNITHKQRYFFDPRGRPEDDYVQP